MRHLLVVLGVTPPRAFDYVTDAICPLHGFLNGIVYGLSNKAILGALWRGLGCRCCRGDAAGGGRWRGASVGAPLLDVVAAAEGEPPHDTSGQGSAVFA